MAEAFYKVGDILEICGQYGMFSPDKKTRCLVLKCIKPGYEFIICTLLVLKADNSFDIVGVNQKDIILIAKQVGHIDISSFLSDNKSNEPDYAMLFAVATIAQVADLRNELDKSKKENERLKAENKALSDTLSKSEDKARSRLDRNEVLKRENEELRGYNKELEQALSKPEMKAHLHKIYELEYVRDKLKVERDEVNHEIDGLRAENEKLRSANARYLQSMTCAEKQMTEATKRIYEAREHMNVALCNN